MIDQSKYGYNPFSSQGFMPAMGMLGSMVSNRYDINPADQAMKYFDQVPGTIKPYYDPYIDAGRNSLGKLMNQYTGLIDDPNAQIAKAGQSFQASPGYQYRLNQGSNAINNAAASGGMLGTPQHQRDAGNMSSDLASNEWNNYLKSYLGQYDTGLQGMSNINQMGYNASNSLAEALATNLMNQGNLAYSSAEHKNQQGNNMTNGFMGSMGGMAGSMIGGPMGGMIGQLAGGFFD